VIAVRRGARRSHCQKVRRGGRGGRGGRAVIVPLLQVPATVIRRNAGTVPSQGASTLTDPAYTDTSSRSTAMPGLVTRMMDPACTLASMCSVGWEMTASVKSSVIVPLLQVRSIRAGTVHRPVRSLDATTARILMSSLAGATPAPAPARAPARTWDIGVSAVPAAGRSATTAVRSS
jgi:hypothetical protein